MKCKICGFEYRGLFCPKCEENYEIEALRTKKESALKEVEFDIECGLCVEEIFLVRTRGIVVTGTVKNMEFSLRQKVYWVNKGIRNEAIIAGIEKGRKMVDKAVDGDMVGILIQGITNEDISCGCMLYTLS